MSTFNSSLYEPKRFVVNRYWKRPKPKVYECNIRDAERFYQESYKDYLKSKEFAASRAQPSHSRSIEDEFASRWGQYRANVNLDSQLSDPFLRNRREGSLGLYGADGSLENYRNALGAYGRSDERSYNRATSLLNNRGPSPPDAELQSIDDRLDRLKKLRDELGLPGEGAENGIPSASGSKSILKKSPSERREPRMLASSRCDSRSKTNDYPDYDESFQTKTEKTTRFARQFSGGEDKYRPLERLPKENGKFSFGGEDDLEKYSVRNYMKTTDRKSGGGENNDFSYKLPYEPTTNRRFGGGGDSEENSYKYSTESKFSSLKNASAFGGDEDSFSKPESKYSRNKYATDDSTYPLESKSSRYKSSKKEDTEDVEEYDDEFLSSLKKKFPTSDEIIDKINKMEVE